MDSAYTRWQRLRDKYGHRITDWFVDMVQPVFTGILILLAISLIVGTYLYEKKPLLRCALHVHTTNSDGQLPPSAMIAAYALHEPPYDVVAITDHDKWYDGPIGVWEICGRKILVLSGREIAEDNAHIIEIEDNKGNLARILAHPNWSNLTQTDFDRIAPTVDAYELWNSSAGFKWNKRSTTPYANQYRANELRAVCVDDAPALCMVGFAATYIRADLTAEAVVKALKGE